MLQSQPSLPQVSLPHRPFLVSICYCSAAGSNLILELGDSNHDAALEARDGRCNPQWRGSYRYCDADQKPDPHRDEEPTTSPGCGSDKYMYAWASCTPDGNSGHVNDNDWYKGDDWCWVSTNQADHLSCNEDGTFELTDEMSCISWSLTPTGSQRHGGCDANDK